LGYDNTKIDDIRGVSKQKDKPVPFDNKYFGLKSGNKVFGFTGPQNTINAIIRIRCGIPKGFLISSLFIGKILSENHNTPSTEKDNKLAMQTEKPYRSVIEILCVKAKMKKQIVIYTLKIRDILLPRRKSKKSRIIGAT